MRVLRSLYSLTLAIVFTGATAAFGEPTVVYVSPAGNDAWSGKAAEPNADKTDGPFASVQAARDAIRRLKSEKKLAGPVRVLMRGGVYRVKEPVVFTAEDSGTKDAPITYAAYQREKPVICGGVPIGGWKRQGDGPVWSTVVPEVKAGDWYFRQLWVNGRRCTPARTPNGDEVFQIAGPIEPLGDREKARRNPDTRLGSRYRNDDLKQWKDLDDAIIVHYHAWTTSRHLVESLDTDKKIVRFRNRSGWPIGWWGEERYYIEAFPEALDAPGEFYLDRKTGVLSYYPREGEDMATAEAVAARPQVLLKLDGDAAAGKPVEHLGFEGLSLQYTSWTMPESDTVDGQAAAFLDDATVFAAGARNCRFQGCEIAHTGGYGLWLQRGCKDNTVEMCHVHDTGAGGVRLGETGLPKEPELQAERNTVHNCFLHDGGNVFHAGVGVWIGKTSHNRITHNEIADYYYTGVSVGWSWGYAPSSANHNLIEHNHIHHLGWGQLSDMGGIYSLGVSPGTQLRYNRIHDVLSFSYGGWGLYTDEGSTGILMENNVVYRVKDGAFHQHYGRENLVRNNVLALSATYGQIRRSRQEEHSSFTIERNIIYGRDVPMLGGSWSNGNYKLDHNCYWDAADGKPEFPGGITLAEWQKQGHDEGSIAADPKFVDPEQADFSLQPDSPALKLGFKPIDTSEIGLAGPDEWKNLPKKYPLPKMVLPGEQ